MMTAPWPSHEADEIAAVSRVLKSGQVNYWTGSEGRLFEQEFAAYCGTDHAIALANGTLALELALRALGIGRGDEVIVPARTFVATASAVVMVGATPVFADIDRNSQNITANTISAVLTPRTRAIICVHLAGWPCDMDQIRTLLGGRNVKLIEDCAQAHGAKYKNRSVGSLGDVAAFSFCQDKIMTTGGEGGMLTLSDESLWRLAWSLKDHGKDWKDVNRRDHAPGFRWLHRRFGSNYRMTEMQAAIGRCQLKKLDSWRIARQQNAAALNQSFMNFASVRVPEIPCDLDHGSYKHYVFIRPECLKPGWSRDRILSEIELRGVPCFTGSCPEIYLEEAFQTAGLSPRNRLPVARELGERSLMFPVHPTLTVTHMAEIGSKVQEVLSLATGSDFS